MTSSAMVIGGSGIRAATPLLRPSEIRSVLWACSGLRRRVSWYKGLNEYSSAITRALTDARVLAPVCDVLGDDVVLWSAQLMAKKAGEAHRWHGDVESSAFPSVNVWIALTNVTPRSTLLYIAGSQAYRTFPQDLLDDAGLASNECVLAKAKEFDSSATIDQVDIEPGQFVMFDGYLWHGSQNTTGHPRTSLLAQFAPVEAQIRRPRTFRSPVEWETHTPLRVQVSGKGRDGDTPLSSLTRRHWSMRQLASDRLVRHYW